MKPISPKRQAQLDEYYALRHTLIEYANKRSELDGRLSDNLEPHHIDGRRGKRLTDPFNIILLSRFQHETEGANHNWERIAELKAKVRPIRLRQGFVDTFIEKE